MHKFFVRLSWGLIFTGMVLLIASMGVYLLGKNHIRNTEPIEATVIDVVPYGETEKRMLLVESPRWVEEVDTPELVQKKLQYVRYYYEGDIDHAWSGKKITGYWKEENQDLLLSLDCYHQYTLFFLIYGSILLLCGGIWRGWLQITKKGDHKRTHKYPCPKKEM